jgi:drug/metabolite transporter (DMT)-like permease
VVIAVPLAVLNGETLPLPSDVAWSVVSGVLGVVGLGCLYHGLGVGRMGVVAPVTGVIVAVIPVTTGIILEGAPPGLALAGIVLAIASVAVVARVPGETADRSSGFWWGVGAGITLGAFTVTISRVSHGLVFGPLAIVRFSEFVACIVVILIARRPWRPARSLWPAFLGIGAIDMIGTAAYLAAAQIGPLAIAAVLSALYPAVTVVFAATILREPMTRLHLIGVVGAAIAVVLIAGGQSG